MANFLNTDFSNYLSQSTALVAGWLLPTGRPGRVLGRTRSCSRASVDGRCFAAPHRCSLNKPKLKTDLKIKIWLTYLYKARALASISKQ